ncbi:MAG TPA: hypothetical protein VGN37_27790 [Actinocatenispora sp.]
MRSLRSTDGAWRVEIDEGLVDYGPLGGVTVRVLHHGVLVAQPDSVAELRRALPEGVLLQFESPDGAADGRRGVAEPDATSG